MTNNSPAIDPCGATAMPNEWYVSCAENGHTAGVCGTGCVAASATATSATLHIGSIPNAPNGMCPPGDCGATYDAGGWCSVLGTGPSTATDKRAESPTINCTGHAGIILNFNYVMGGQIAQDYCEIEYSINNGAVWNFLASPNTTTLCGGMGTWSAYAFALPATCDNNPNVKIGFHWYNDDDGSGSDPSFAVDNMTFSSTGGNTITTGAIIGSPFCACTIVNVPFTSTGTFAAGNIYTAQLSNASGNFGSPFTIGTLSSTANSGMLACTIPCNASGGSGYLIRVISSNPAVVGSNNGANITINALPAANFSYIGSPYCAAGLNPSPTYSNGGIAGTFTATPAGLTMDSNTGMVTLNSSLVGTYTVTNTIAASGGCPGVSAASIITIVAQPAPVISSVGAIISCGGGSVTLTASTINGGNYVWNTTDTTQSITVTTPGAYTVTESYAGSSCTGTSAPFNLATVLPAVPLCLVTVDNLSTHNIVVWEKTGVGAEIDSFRIYRETMTNVYSNIASVSNDSLSEYHDYGANPNVTSYKYKIATLDTCGNVSAMSDFHNTIHLQYLGNGNLQWTLYDIENAGNPVNFYIINRDDNNTGNFLPISSTIPGSNSTFTDINYLTYPNARYRADVTWSILCTPTRDISTTRSNIIQQATSVSVSQAEFIHNITIIPNPFFSQTTITFNEPQKSTIITITDVLGKEIKTIHFAGKECVIEKGEMNAGIYFVQITGENKNVVNRKLVVE